MSWLWGSKTNSPPPSVTSYGFPPGMGASSSGTKYTTSGIPVRNPDKQAKRRAAINRSVAAQVARGEVSGWGGRRSRRHRTRRHRSRRRTHRR